MWSSILHSQFFLLYYAIQCFFDPVMQHFFHYFILVSLFCFSIFKPLLLFCNFPFFRHFFVARLVNRSTRKVMHPVWQHLHLTHRCLTSRHIRSINHIQPLMQRPHLTIEILNPQMVLVASVSICLIGSLGMICQVSSAKSMKLRDQQMIKVEFANHWQCHDIR